MWVVFVNVSARRTTCAREQEDAGARCVKLRGVVRRRELRVITARSRLNADKLGRKWADDECTARPPIPAFSRRTARGPRESDSDSTAGRAGCCYTAVDGGPSVLNALSSSQSLGRDVGGPRRGRRQATSLIRCAAISPPRWPQKAG
jgi:hypothetical protein